MLSSILLAQSHSASTLCQASSGRAIRIFLISPLGLPFALSLSVFIDFIIVHSIAGFDPAALAWYFSVLGLSPCFDCSIDEGPPIYWTRSVSFLRGLASRCVTHRR